VGRRTGSEPGHGRRYADILNPTKVRQRRARYARSSALWEVRLLQGLQGFEGWAAKRRGFGASAATSAVTMRGIAVHEPYDGTYDAEG
jgi:hypothetical protein